MASERKPRSSVSFRSVIRGSTVIFVDDHRLALLDRAPGKAVLSGRFVVEPER